MIWQTRHSHHPGHQRNSLSVSMPVRSSATGECGLITQHNEHRITFCLVWLCAGEHNKNNNGDLLFALPIASCGLKLDDAAVRVAVGLRLGLYLCVPLCRCGSPIDARGLHSLVGKQAPGRSSRHHMPNDLVVRAFAAAGVPCSCQGATVAKTTRDQMVSR